MFEIKTRKIGSQVNLRESVSAEAYGIYHKPQEFIARVIHKSHDEIEKIKKCISHNFMFSSLDDKDLNTVINAMEETSFKSGEIVIKEGYDGDVLYLVQHGELDCTKNIQGVDTFIKTYIQGEAFGELALLYNAPRAATIKANTDCILWALDRETFNHIVKNSAIKRREMHYNFLKSVEILSSMDDYEITQVCDSLKTMKFKAGEHIIKQGEIGDNFYIIEEGQAYASKLFDGGNID
jgi:cAMP-dependent protein kinase regulator